MDALDGFRLSDGGDPELATDYEVYPTQSAADHFRCLPWAYGKRCGGSTGSALAALHGAFLPQRLQSRVANQGSRREPYAQGSSRPGNPGSGRQESTRDRQPVRGQDEYGGQFARAGRSTDPDLVRKGQRDAVNLNAQGTTAQSNAIRLLFQYYH
jgi:hypothetical protein